MTTERHDPALGPGRLQGSEVGQEPPAPALPHEAQPTHLASLRHRWLSRAPLLLAALLICGFNAANLDRLVRAQAPRNPWEATEVLEAWRSVQGMTVYDLSKDGHSTHVYGALAPWVQGEIFRWTGPNNVSGRLLSLISALAAVTVLAFALRGERSGWYLVLAWAMLLGVNYRSWEYFAENRPDMTSILFTALGVLLLGHGQESGRRRYSLLGTLCLVAGFFFKQTALTFCAVPLLVLGLRWRKPSRSEVLWAVFPLAVAFGVVCALRVFCPAVYYYMITVHTAFAHHLPAAVRNVWELLLDSPLFLVLLGEWIVVDGASLRRDSRMVWLVAVLSMAIPFSALTLAKAGGAPNSLLPALFAMSAFCVLRLPRLTRYLDRPAAQVPARLALGVFLALLMMLTAFPRLSTKHSLLVPRSPHEAAYWKLVELVRRLPGTTRSPEDPTITFYATRRVDLNIFSEYDTHLVNGDYPSTPPDRVIKELNTADYLVDVRDDRQDLLDDDFFETLGFEPVTALDAELVPADYRLWQRKRPAGSVAAEATNGEAWSRILSN